jgi:cyanophycinase-like exopeptidase
MKWFLERADGGDVVVIRVSGEDGYNDYLYSDLGIEINSVETILFNSADASNDDYVINQIENAEALWIAGGDQWDYVSYWKRYPCRRCN